MKVLVTGYRINQFANTIRFGECNPSYGYDSNVWYKDWARDPYTGVSNIDLKRVLTVINLENNEILYSMADSSLGGSISNGELLLDKSISSLTGSERLEIWYDTPLPIYPYSVISGVTGSTSTFFTTPDLTLDSPSCFFIISASTYGIGNQYNYVIEENYNGTYKPIYECYLTSATFVTPIINFSTTKIRIRYGMPSQITLSIKAVPVYSTDTSSYRSLTRVYADNFYKGALDGFQFNSPTTAITVPTYAKKVRAEIYATGITGYTDRSTTLTASNNRIDIQTATSGYQFTVTAGTYATPALLATAINSAISASSVSCVYNSTSRVMEFYSTLGDVFSLLFASGTNSTNTIANAVGFPKKDCFGMNFYIAPAPMCNYSSVWLEGSAESSFSSAYKLYTSPDLVSFPLSSTNLTRYSSASTLIEAMTAIQVGSNVLQSYIEAPTSGFNFIRLNSYSGTQGVHYSGTLSFLNAKLVFE